MIRQLTIIFIRNRTPLASVKSAGRWLGRIVGPVPDWHIILMHGSRCYAGELDLSELPDDDSEAIDK